MSSDSCQSDSDGDTPISAPPPPFSAPIFYYKHQVRDALVTFSSFAYDGVIHVPVQRRVTDYLSGSVYVAGGRNANNQTMSSVVRLDVARGQWSDVNPMATQRYCHAMTASVSGRWMYVMGGVNASREFLTSGEVYDSQSGEWSALPPMACARHSHVVAQVGGGGSGSLYVVGGVGESRRFLASVERLDLRKPLSWEKVGAMSVARHGHVALEYKGRLHVIGGDNAGGSVEVLDEVTRTWSMAAPLLIDRRDHTAAVLADGWLYVVGGRNVTAPAMVSGERLGEDGMIAPMAFARFGHAMVVLSGGCDLVVTGGGGDGSSNPLRSAERYDSVRNAWTLLPPMVTARWGHQSVVVGDAVYVIGGKGADNVPLASVEVLGSNHGAVWTEVTPLMSAERCYHTAAVL